MSAPGRPRAYRLAPVLLLAFLSAVAWSCGGPGEQSVRGLVVAVEASGPVEWESLTVRDATGQELTFRRGTEVDLRFWRASHLRDHMARAEPVTITYRRTGDGLVAVEIED